MTQGIPTMYADTLFRSRLEARWAAMFDLVGWPWIYEPFDGDGYLPDFLIDGPAPLLVEIKPAVTIDEYQSPIPKIIDGIGDLWRHDVLILGAGPCPAFGHGRITGVFIDFLHDQTDWHESAAEWRWCGACEAAGVAPEEQSGSRPCGHEDAKHGNGTLPAILEAAWRVAGNRVQWKAA